MREPKSARSGTLRVHVVQPGVIGTVYAGYISTALAEGMLPEFIKTLDRHPATHWILDSLRVTGFDSKIALNANPWVEAFKAHGGQMMITIATSAAVRLVVSSLGFAVGVSSKAVETFQQAKELLPR
jgi:hypothetical protein